MVNTLRFNADHGRHFHPIADHLTKLRNLTKAEIRNFSAFPFLLQLMFDKLEMRRAKIDLRSDLNT